MPDKDHKVNGRPTGYRPEYDEQARRLCLMGVSDEQLCIFFHIDILTLAEWARGHEGFFDAITPERHDVESFRAKQEEKKSKRRAWKKNYMNSSESRRIERATRARVHSATTGKTASISGMPFAVEQLRDHLQSMFSDGMNWDNYGKWHIDHIKPCSLFKQDDMTEFKECWSLQNLQPMWASDNIKKGNKYGSS